MNQQDTNAHLEDDLDLEGVETPEGTEGSNEEAQEKTSEAEAVESEENSESDPETQEKPRKRSGIQRRIDREKRKTEQVQEEFDRYKAENQQQQQPKDSDEPSPEDYEKGDIDKSYIRDLAKYEGLKAYQEAKEQDEQLSRHNKAQQKMRDAQDNYSEKLDEAAEKYDDFDDSIANSEVEFRDPNVQQAIMTSDSAGELAYYLSKNPKEATKISNMDPISAVRAIGRIEGSFNAKTAPPKRKKSSMTPPLDTVGSGTSTTTMEYSDDITQADFEKQFPNLPN